MSRRSSQRPSRKGNLPRRLLLVVLGLVLGVNAYLSNARNVVGDQMPMPFGVGAAVVLSGSMEPTLSRGDLILVHRTDTVSPGDIVVYQSENHLVVHRVIAVNGDTVVTQGDANNTPDDPIQRDRIRGAVALYIPYVGTVLNLIKTPAGIIIVLALAFALIELSFRREKQQDEQDIAAVKDEIRRLKDELNQQ